MHNLVLNAGALVVLVFMWSQYKIGCFLESQCNPSVLATVLPVLHKAIQILLAYIKCVLIMKSYWRITYMLAWQLLYVGMATADFLLCFARMLSIHRMPNLVKLASFYSIMTLLKDKAWGYWNSCSLSNRFPTLSGWWNSWTFPGLFQDLIYFSRTLPPLKQQWMTHRYFLLSNIDFHCRCINRANNDSAARTKKYELIISKICVNSIYAGITKLCGLNNE